MLMRKIWQKVNRTIKSISLDLLFLIRRGPQKKQNALIRANSALIGRQRALSVLQGQKSRDWGHIPDRHGKPSLRIRFPLPVCRSCPLHAQCTPVSAKVLILRPDQQSFQALQEARKRQGTPEFRALYAKRAGIEGTVAQAVRTCEIRRARYIGLKKLNLQAFLTATSMNVLRACHWLAEEKQAAKPSSRFAKLVASVQQQEAA